MNTRRFNKAVAQAGFALGLSGALLNAYFHDMAWTVLCAASMTVSLFNLYLLREPDGKTRP